MKSFNQILLIATLLFNFSLSADTGQKPPVLSLDKLLGQWRVKDIYFAEQPTDTRDKYNSYHMHQGIVRFDFKAAGEFSYVVPNKTKNKPEEGRYWTWALNSDQRGFVITQLARNKPPFDFGLSATVESVVEAEGYTDIILAVQYHADKTTAKVILTNLKDANWDAAANIHNL